MLRAIIIACLFATTPVMAQVRTEYPAPVPRAASPEAPSAVERTAARTGAGIDRGARRTGSALGRAANRTGAALNRRDAGPAHA
jgi:hypothetical protein